MGYNWISSEYYCPNWLCRLLCIYVLPYIQLLWLELFLKSKSHILSSIPLNFWYNHENTHTYFYKNIRSSLYLHSFGKQLLTLYISYLYVSELLHPCCHDILHDIPPSFMKPKSLFWKLSPLIFQLKLFWSDRNAFLTTLFCVL